MRKNVRVTSWFWGGKSLITLLFVEPVEEDDFDTVSLGSDTDWRTDDIILYILFFSVCTTAIWMVFLTIKNVQRIDVNGIILKHKSFQWDGNKGWSWYRWTRRVIQRDIDTDTDNEHVWPWPWLCYTVTTNLTCHGGRPWLSLSHWRPILSNY